MSAKPAFSQTLIGSMTKKLINNPGSVVHELLDGIVQVHPHLQRLDGFPDIKVVYNTEHDSTTVAIVSGGGSGHEPAHAGYVGKGMLAAAVCGDVFASPSAAAVLAAIRQVTGPAGCLLVIKNYTGDRLHFGLAAERARAEGYKVEVVVVGEDVAIEETGLAGRRGLAGTAFVHKVAGAAAAAGQPLEDVVKVAQQAADTMATLGVALTVCTLPGHAPSDRLGPGEMEVGLGIHGEPGTFKTQVKAVDEVVELMLERVVGYRGGALGVKEGSRVALMVNNLGATPPMELYVAARAALAALEGKYQVTVERTYVGPFMTSLDMAGISLTLLLVDDDTLERLDAATSAPGWPAASAVRVPGRKPTPVPEGKGAGVAAAAPSRPAQLSAEGVVLERALLAAAKALIEAEPQLTEYDQQVGDGDCGDTIARAAAAIQAAATTTYPLNSPSETAAALAETVGHAVGGTSGALYGLFFTASARSLQESSSGGAAAYTAALKAGTEAVQEFGGAREGFRTMLDALLPAVRAAEDALAKGVSGPEVAAAAAAAAAAGAEATRSMDAKAGRASYVPGAAGAAVPDPGAAAVAVWVQAVASALAA